jgi:ClpX C4-type zinc finger
MTTTTVSCSFCGKDDKTVRKMIAGPGVYICDGCVGLCVTILDDDAAAPQPGRPRLPVWDTMSTDEMLAYVPRIAAVADQVEGGLRDGVRELRMRDVTWERIGTALGVTRQSAWGRFSGEE